MQGPRKIADAGKDAGKKVLATDTAQGVVGAVVDKLEEIAVDKADDAAATVKQKVAKAGGRSPKRSTSAKKSSGRKKSTAKKPTGRKKSSAKKSTAKKSTASTSGGRRKSPAKKSPAKKSPGRKKSTAKKPTAKKR